MRVKLTEIIKKPLSGEWGTDDTTGDGFLVLRTTNFTNDGIVNYDNVVLRCITKKNISEKLLKKGDILIEKSGGSDKQPVGRVVFFDGEEMKYLFNNFTSLLRVNDSENWNSKYVFYSLYANYLRGGTLPYQNKTTGLHNLKLDSYISNYTIKNISIDEQNRIVQHLDLVCSIIELQNELLSKLDELIKSRFVEMFGDLETNPMNWAVETIDNISIFLKSGLSRKLSDEDIGIPVIRSGNIQNGAFYPADIKYWYKDDPQGANTKDYILDDGDILINFINSVSQIGKAAIFRSIGRDCIYTTNLFRMKLADNCNEYYFNWFAMSDYYFRQIQSIIQPAVNQASFTTGNFLKLNIPLPPMEKQLHFATFVKEVDKSKLAVKQSIEKLETIKKSLMQEYFG